MQMYRIATEMNENARISDVNCRWTWNL